MAAPEAPLAGLRVLVTRPRHQNEQLCELIRAAGGAPLVFPLLEIAPPRDVAGLDQVLDTLPQTDMAIFISANAVAFGLARVRARLGAMPAQVRLAAVGQASAQALATEGLTDVLVPSERFDSEALLALPALQQIQGRRVVIFRGEGGREHLATTLRERGAQVAYAECYRRLRPPDDGPALRALLDRDTIDIVVVTSGEALATLHAWLGPALAPLPLLVVSERIAAAARAAGARQVQIADAASDTALIAALRAWRHGQNSL
jgi:uroporphyrinogen-III synthase